MNGFTFQPGDPVELVVCPLRDGRRGGAIGIVIKDDIWYTPNDGGCGPNFDAWVIGSVKAICLSRQHWMRGDFA